MYLESIQLSNAGLHRQPVDEITLATHASLTELLRVPSSRFVAFRDFFCTLALCPRTTANELMEGKAITSLEFAYSFCGHNDPKTHKVNEGPPAE
jgi:hypothetical protein